jgi:hypothetical protein
MVSVPAQTANQAVMPEALAAFAAGKERLSLDSQPGRG